jgi:hypothetical protein
MTAWRRPLTVDKNPLDGILDEQARGSSAVLVTR